MPRSGWRPRKPDRGIARDSRLIFPSTHDTLEPAGRSEASKIGKIVGVGNFRRVACVERRVDRPRGVPNFRGIIPQVHARRAMCSTANQTKTESESKQYEDLHSRCIALGQVAASGKPICYPDSMLNAGRMLDEAGYRNTHLSWTFASARSGGSSAERFPDEAATRSEAAKMSDLMGG